MRLDENINRIKEVMGLITEAVEPSNTLEINLGNLFESGKYKLTQQNIASINDAILKLRNFSKKTPNIPIVVTVESSESKVPNYDREKFPSTGDRNVDFTDEKKMQVGALSTIRAKSIQDYLTNKLNIPNTKINVVNKGAQGPEWKSPYNANDPAYTANQYVKILANLQTTQKTEPTTDYSNITKEMVLTGSYFCNGKNSLGVNSAKNTYTPQCDKLKQNLKDGNHISAFEIKWNANVVKDAYVRPVKRWNMYWNEIGKIVSIRRIDNLKSEEINQGTPVKLDDPELKYYMNINGVDVYGKFIQPYI